MFFSQSTNIKTPQGVGNASVNKAPAIEGNNNDNKLTYKKIISYCRQ